MLRDRIMMGATISSLPAGYTKIEYLESDGTQFIDTGFTPNADTRVVADMLLVRNNTNQGANVFFGARTSASALAYALQYNNSRGNMQLFYWNGYSELADSFPSSRVVYDLNKNVLSYNGKSIRRTYSDWIAHYPMYIFALNNAGTPTFMSIARLYSFRIYDNGTLIRDYVPCSNPIGVKGLWDKVNEEFYALTPTGYTRLAYLESNGSDYIDTGFKPNQDTRVVMDVELNSQSSYPKVLFGARNGSTTSNASFIVWAITANGFRTDFGSESLVTTVAPIGRFVIDKNKNVTTFNGIEYTNPAYTFQCEYNIGLFTEIDVDGPDNRVSAAKLYSCKIYDNGVKVRDFIPCTNPDGISGLWDSENDVFYKLLPADYTRLDFIETDGTTYIDTGFKPNSNTRVIFEGYNNNANSKWLFGTWNASGSGQFGISMQTGAGVRYGKQTAAITSQNVGEVYAELNKTAYNFNGTTGTLNAETFTCSYNLFIGALNNVGTPTDSSYGFIGRIYSVKIYDYGTLVRDFIPAMNASGEAGLYDLKNDVWYALLPVAKPKVENKISIWKERLGFGNNLLTTKYGFESEYPVASEIRIASEIRYFYGDSVDYENAVYKMSEGTSKTEALEIFSNQLLQGGIIDSITSISPTEDDTYIYTF